MGRMAGQGRWLRRCAAVATIATAGCGSSSTATSGEAMPSGSMGGAAMMLQPGADQMKAVITAPSDGSVVTANTLSLTVATSGYEDTCDLAGKENVQGKGHYHLLIDKSLVNMFCSPNAVLSLQNLKPGKHTIAALPAQDDHAEVEKNESAITVDYEPAAPSSALQDRPASGAPSIKILSPTPGAVVSGPFDVTVQISNFEDSCDLFGKPDVAGYGHWHLNIDSTSAGMMGMGTMLGMSCTGTFHATTRGLKPGSSHNLIALLVDNGHAPLKPEVSDRVPVTVAG